MPFSLNFKTENAAFADGNGAQECADILKDIVKLIEKSHLYDGKVTDWNGNVVGKWSMTIDAEDGDEDEEDEDDEDEEDDE